MKTEAEILIFDSILEKCVLLLETQGDRLPKDVDINFLADQMAMINESGIKALAYNNGDIQSTVSDLADLPTRLHELPAPMEVVLQGIKSNFSNQIEAFIYLFENQDMDEVDLINDIQLILD